MGSSPAGGTRQIQCKSARRKRAFFSKDVLQMVFPVDMSLHKKSKRFDIAFDDGQSFSFSFEFLRVFSPSAEVTGHTPDQAKLQVGKRDVDVKGVMPFVLFSTTATIPASTVGSICTISARVVTNCGKAICSSSRMRGQAVILPIRPMCRSCPSPRRLARPNSTDNRHGRRKSAQGE